MARRYSGDVVVTCTYRDEGHYDCTVSTPSETVDVQVMPPASGYGRGVAYDSPEAYDQVAHAALSFVADDHPDLDLPDLATDDPTGTGWWVGRSKAEAFPSEAIGLDLRRGREASRTGPEPGAQHLPGATKTENRQYEHIYQSSRARGYSVARSKQIAAATVNKERSARGETRSREFDERHSQGRFRQRFALTTADAGPDFDRHSHCVYFDEKRTSQDEDHFHVVRNGRVLPAVDGHTHGITGKACSD